MTLIGPGYGEAAPGRRAPAVPETPRRVTRAEHLPKLSLEVQRPIRLLNRYLRSPPVNIAVLVVAPIAPLLSDESDSRATHVEGMLAAPLIFRGNP